MRAGACIQCVVERRCCGACWCCPWPALWDHCYEEVTDRDGWAQPCGLDPVGTHVDPEDGHPYPVCLTHLRDSASRLLVGMIDLLHRRPDLRDALPLRPLADCITDSVLMGA